MAPRRAAEGLGHALKRRLRGRGRFIEGFVAASLPFCVGPITLVGSLQNGLAGDARARLVNGVGGLMILGLGPTLLDVRSMAVAAMLPALPLVVVLYEIAARLR